MTGSLVKQWMAILRAEDLDPEVSQSDWQEGYYMGEEEYDPDTGEILDDEMDEDLIF